jgi:hypothetical protein
MRERAVLAGNLPGSLTPGIIILIQSGELGTGPWNDRGKVVVPSRTITTTGARVEERNESRIHAAEDEITMTVIS